MDLNLFKNHKLEPGHSACAGCGAAIAMKIVSSAVPTNTRVVIPACCWSIILGKHPFSSLKLATIHSPFAFAAAFATGIKAALEAKNDNSPVMVWAGDGATYDIGFGLLSAAAERNEDILYICYDNEGYMNTGAQRSSATPSQAVTPTTPKGKRRPKKDIVEILNAHNIPYIATASIAYPEDMINKVKKALTIKGFKFILVQSPCPTGWGFDPSLTVKIARLAVECGIFPLLEIENGSKRITLHPKGTPKEEYYALQKRFSQQAL